METSPLSTIVPTKEGIDNVSKANVKISNPSSARSSKSAIPAYTNKIISGRCPLKTEVKSQNGPAKNAYQRTSSLSLLKTTGSKISTATKSSTRFSMNTTASTKTPVTKNPVRNTNRSAIDRKFLTKPSTPRKNPQQKEIAENNPPIRQPPIKKKQFQLFNVKRSTSSISEPAQVKSSVSKFTKVNLVKRNQDKSATNLKTQLSRTGSENNFASRKKESHSKLYASNEVINENFEIGAEKFWNELKAANLEKKCQDLIQKHLKDQQNLEKDLTEKAGAISAKKDVEIKELQEKYNIQEREINNLKSALQNFITEKDSLEKDLKSHKESSSMANQMLQDSQQQLQHEKLERKNKNETITKLEHELLKVQKLEEDLRKEYEDLQIKITEKFQMEFQKLLKQNAELLSKAGILENEKATLKHQNKQFELDVLELTTVKEKLLNSENKMQELQFELNKSNEIVEKMTDCSKEHQVELDILRRSEAGKQQEIEQLKSELSTTQLNICKLEQQLQRSQELLGVRIDIINSLQTNEKTNQIHIEELLSQLGEKNGIIRELNFEFQTKSEEYRNLFSSMSSKQMELGNQKHIIKLLEESNERSQVLRANDEQTIAKLKEELSNLKQTIADTATMRIDCL